MRWNETPISPTEHADKAVPQGVREMRGKMKLMLEGVESLPSSGAMAIALAVNNSGGAKLTRENIVDAVIAYANGEGNVDMAFLHTSENECLYARTMLCAAADSRDQLLQWLDSSPQSEGSVVLVPRFNLRQVGEERIGEFTTEIEGPPQPEPWIYYAGFVIAETAVGETTAIGQCRWKNCQRFFRIIIRGKGLPARHYCPGSDHQKRARPSSYERVKKHRVAKKNAAQNSKISLVNRQARTPKSK